MDRDAKSEWYAFFASEGERLRRYVCARAQRLSRMDAEDVVSEVMLSMLSRVEKTGPVENLAAYAYRSIRNKLADRQRENAKTARMDAPYEDAFPGLLADASAGVENEAERRELARKLKAAVDALEPKQRAVFVATELYGKSFRQLSEEWGEPVGTLLSRKCRAVKVLRAALEDWKNQV